MSLLPKSILSLALLSSCVATSASELVVDRVFVKKITEVDLAAPKAGLLAVMSVHEGQSVARDQELARLDDRSANIDLQRAQIEFEVASQQAKDQGMIALAEKKLQQQRQSLKQYAIENVATHRQAKNRLSVEAAEKSSAVAKNELDRAQRARNEFADSVSQSEIDGLMLAHQRADLEAKQAEFQRQQDVLAADASDESMLAHKLSIEQLEIELAKTNTDHRLATLNASLFENALEAAHLNLQQHRVAAPFDGVVVEVYRQQGEWVKPGDPVIRVLRLNRLRVEGFISTDLLHDDLVGCRAEIRIEGAAKQLIEFHGTITFVSPEVDAVNNEVSIWAEFDNLKLLAWPGMQGEMTIQLGKPNSDLQPK